MLNIKNIVKLLFPGLVNLYKLIKQLPTKYWIKKMLVNRKNINLEIGAGPKAGQSDWLTLDMNNFVDIYWDLRRGIPFPDNSLSSVYSSHFLEHLSFKEIETILKEVFRVLKPNGIFSVCVPNGELFIYSYINDIKLDPKVHFTHAPAFNHTTKIDYINYIAFMDGNHKYLFDIENLIFLLKKAGFKNVKERKFDKSIDNPKRDHESIYAICSK